jgi:hypothetical protein
LKYDWLLLEEKANKLLCLRKAERNTLLIISDIQNILIIKESGVRGEKDEFEILG